MENLKVAFFIDKVEFQYFSFHRLVTTFWLIKECNARSWEVYISTANQLFLKDNIPHANLFKTSLHNTKGSLELTREKECNLFNLNNFDLVFFRPDPPVDIDYINSTYILDFIDQTKTTVVNSPSGIRNTNEKVCINRFPKYVPPSIVTSTPLLIKEFLEEHNEIVLKPINKCFGKGVFYLKKGDKNINSIIDSSTDSGKTVIMAQEFINTNAGGDKRVNIICGNVLEEAITKLYGDGDFKFNTHSDECFKKVYITDREREICNEIAPQLMSDGLYLVGLDMLGEKIIEINVTSPCFFIKEMNQFFNTNLEVTIIDHIESLIASRKKDLSLIS
jgi:glutathione synthase